MLRDWIEEILYDSQKIPLDPTYGEHHGMGGGWSKKQLLGSKEWPNNLGMGGLMETITPTEGSL